MSSNSEFTEASLRGEWIALARDWLSKYGPCDRNTYIIGVRQLMPLHIVDRQGARIPQMRLAVDALRRIGVTNQDGSVSAIERKTGSLTGATNLLRKRIDAEGRLVAKDVRDINNAASLLRQMVDRGEIVRVSPGVFRKLTDIEKQNKTKGLVEPCFTGGESTGV